MKYEYDGRSGLAPRLSVVRSQGGATNFGRLGQLLGIDSKDFGKNDDEEDWFEDEDSEDDDDDDSKVHVSCVA